MIDAYLLTAKGERRDVQQVGVTLSIHRDRMQIGSNGSVAVHRRHSWQIGNDRFLVMKIDSRVTVRLASNGEPRTLGPFDELWIVDGMILADLDEDKGIAEFDETSKLWICPNDETAWETVVFTQA